MNNILSMINDWDLLKEDDNIVIIRHKTCKEVLTFYTDSPVEAVKRGIEGHECKKGACEENK